MVSVRIVSQEEFERMLETIREDVTRILATAELQFPAPAMELPELPEFLTAGDAALPSPGGMFGAGISTGSLTSGDPYAGMNLSRNAPCPCGSGQKYKHCHGTAA